jgi:hypothetical protein
VTASARAGRYNPDDPALSDEVSRRHAALTAAAAGVRVRRGSKIPVEHILLVGGSILLPLGVVFILLGWHGAATTGRSYEQIDYLISGGLLGVGFIAAGGFMYFGYWLSRQLGESRRQSALILQAFQSLEQALEGAIVTGETIRPASAAPTPGTLVAVAAVPPTDAAATTNGGTRRQRAGARAAAKPSSAAVDDTPASGVSLLVATPHGSLLHRPDCPVVTRREGVRALPAGSDGYGYCTMCDAAGVLT